MSYQAAEIELFRFRRRHPCGRSGLVYFGTAPKLGPTVCKIGRTQNLVRYRLAGLKAEYGSAAELLGLWFCVDCYVGERVFQALEAPFAYYRPDCMNVVELVEYPDARSMMDAVYRISEVAALLENVQRARVTPRPEKIEISLEEIAEQFRKILLRHAVPFRRGDTEKRID